MRLIRAKRNVDMFYAVVGVLEDMPGTIKALEGYIPRWALRYFLVVFSSPPNCPTSISLHQKVSV